MREKGIYTLKIVCHMASHEWCMNKCPHYEGCKFQVKWSTMNMNQLVFQGVPLIMCSWRRIMFLIESASRFIFVAFHENLWS